MDAREETRRYGKCSLDGNLQKVEQEFWAGVRKGLREMRARSISEEAAFNKRFPQSPAPTRRRSFMFNLVMVLPILLVMAVCLFLVWRLSLQG